MSLQTPSSSFEEIPVHQCFATKTTLYEQRPWAQVQKRKQIVAEFPTPGPNAMPMPHYIGRQVPNSAIVRRPAWSMQSRPERKQCTYPAGPASHSIGGLSVKGGKVSSPAFTMRPLPKERGAEELPGPASYTIQQNLVIKRFPAFSLRRKTTYTSKHITPGPNEYSLPTILGHHHTPASHTLSSRLYNKPPAVTPGPDAHAQISLDSYLHAAPAFSLRTKAVNREQESTPAPNAYCPENVILTRPFAARPTFRIKHSPYSGQWNPRIVGPTCC